MVNNIAGLYAIKITGDYAEALERYKQALQAVQNTRDTINQSILLGNIASIYYHRRDTAGYRYASEAYRLARLSADHYSMTYSALQLSQMLYLKKEYASAAAYLEEVAGIATGYPQFHAQFHLLQANMYADRSDYAKAEDYYRKALDTQEHTEPGVMASIHLDYGKMLWKQGRTDKASEILLKGLSISDSIGSIEYKHELLLALSELSSATGRKDEALEYYKKYHGYAEKLFGIQKERAFQRLENEEERSALKDEINGHTNVGGIVGYNGDLSKVRMCENLGEISGSQFISGISGVTYSTVSASANRATINGGQYAGGVSGAVSGPYSYLVANYNTGEIHGTSYVGGITGVISNNGLVTACYSVSGIVAESTFGGACGSIDDEASQMISCFYAGFNGPALGNGSAECLYFSDGTEVPSGATAGWPSDSVEQWGINTPGNDGQNGLWWKDLGTEGSQDYPELWWE